MPSWPFCLPWAAFNSSTACWLGTSYALPRTTIRHREVVWLTDDGALSTAFQRLSLWILSDGRPVRSDRNVVQSLRRVVPRGGRLTPGHQHRYASKRPRPTSRISLQYLPRGKIRYIRNHVPNVGLRCTADLETRAFADYIVCSLILHFFCVNFIN